MRDSPERKITGQEARSPGQHDDAGRRAARDYARGCEDGSGGGRLAAAERGDEVCGEGADAESDAHLDGGDDGGAP